jgi:hypothetical protein
MGKTLYEDQRRMEAIVKTTPLDWTIVRPSGLFSGTGVSAYQVSEGPGSGRFTSRQDLADCMLREAGPSGHHRPPKSSGSPPETHRASSVVTAVSQLTGLSRDEAALLRRGAHVVILDNLTCHQQSEAPSGSLNRWGWRSASEESNTPSRVSI